MMRWIDGIKDAINLSIERLSEAVQDRREWKVNVHGDMMNQNNWSTEQ